MKPIVLSVAASTENQDRGLAMDDSNQLILTVADGAGGSSGGSEAATLLIQCVKAGASRLHSAEECSNLLREIDSIICRDRHAGETTGALAVVSKTEVFGSSVGDSGVWFIPETGGYCDLTGGQTRKPLLGSGGRPRPFFCPRQRGILLLASDGLFKYAAAQKIVETCRTVPFADLPEHLVSLIRLPSGALHDDVTVVLTNVTELVR